jgi:hypothetical protein
MPRPAGGHCVFGCLRNTPDREGFHCIPKEGLDGERRARIEARGFWRHSAEDARSSGYNQQLQVQSEEILGRASR